MNPIGPKRNKPPRVPTRILSTAWGQAVSICNGPPHNHDAAVKALYAGDTWQKTPALESHFLEKMEAGLIVFKDESKEDA